MSVLSIDFDGVIHDKAHPLDGRRMGAPLPGAVEIMEVLQESGNTLIIHTTMAKSPGGKKAVEDWLDYYDVPFDEVTAIKPIADAYLDDKAIRFTDWPTAENDLAEYINTDD